MNYEIRAGMSDMPVFFIHGNIASNRWWSPLVELLAEPSQSGLETGFESESGIGSEFGVESEAEVGSGATPNHFAPFILAEWSGCGHAAPAKSENELQPQVLAEKFLKWIDDQGITKLQVVGHSAGGFIAQHMMIARPELFDRGVLIGSVGMQGLRLKPDSLEKFEQLKHDKKFLELTLAFTIYRQDRELYEVCPHFDELLADAQKMDELNWVGVVRQFANLDLSAQLKKLDVPILLLHGVHDSVIPVEEARAIAKTAPRAELIELPNNGHNPFVESPAEMAKFMRDFLL